MSKKLMGLICAAALLAGCQGGDKKSLSTEKDRESYSIGFQIGADFVEQGLDVDPKVLAQGIRDAMEKKEALLGEKEREETLSALQRKWMVKQQEMMAAREKEMTEMAGKNLTEGEAFLAANKAKEGVKTLESGLQYKVLTPGEGKSPKATDKVTVHYRGTLLDGTEFDSSHKRGEPAVFQVDQVIPGWTEALKLMKPGAKWELYIPAKLAYGERGAGQKIAPNATLVFEVELLKVN